MAFIHTKCTGSSDTNVNTGISSKMMKYSVFCLVHVLFCVTRWNISVYIVQIAQRHSPVFCFQHANLTHRVLASSYLQIRSLRSLTKSSALCLHSVLYFAGDWGIEWGGAVRCVYCPLLGIGVIEWGGAASREPCSRSNILPDLVFAC